MEWKGRDKEKMGAGGREGERRGRLVGRREGRKKGGKERGVLHGFMCWLMADSFIHAPAHHYPHVSTHFHLVASHCDSLCWGWGDAGLLRQTECMCEGRRGEERGGIKKG
ncbi:hypothetical protein E2C01_087346 [Portunus trituberculatus]|uniref:Uncharacterized protein n=1 Tax=Portunus trituberculatus TaxID=210409 RepID=A0A5B7JFX8_PORTR|nr:hypothetical protein [Portunus trituberculatus]